MSPETQTVLTTVGEGLAVIILAALSAVGATNRKLRAVSAPELDPVYVASVDSRLSSVSKDVVERSHDFKNKLAVYEMENNRRDIAFAKLEGRVDRAAVDIKDTRSELLHEFRRLEDLIETRFRDMNDKMDRMVQHTRRSGDSDE